MLGCRVWVALWNNDVNHDVGNGNFADVRARLACSSPCTLFWWVHHHVDPWLFEVSLLYEIKYNWHYSKARTQVLIEFEYFMMSRQISLVSLRSCWAESNTALPKRQALRLIYVQWTVWVRSLWDSLWYRSMRTCSMHWPSWIQRGNVLDK